MVSKELETRVLAKIDELEPELIRVAVELADIPSLQPNERNAAEYVFNFYKENGIEAKKVGAPERFNVLGKYPGTGGGRSVVFCSHLDSGLEGRLGILDERNEQLNKLWTKSWREGDLLFGNGIANDRGSMACWMMAAKAIKALDVRLPGTILLSSVLAETGGSPVDEFPSPRHDSHEMGARYVATHGGLADYALVAESTDFTICPVECGFAYFKVTLYGGLSKYTPFFPYPEPSIAKSVNPIFRMAKFLDQYYEYAVEYMKKHSFSFEGGTKVTPKTSVGAIRAGMPYSPSTTPEWCAIYLDCRIPPGTDPLEVQRDLEELLRKGDLDGKVEMFKYLPGFEAMKVKGYDAFKKAIEGAHQKVFGELPKKAVAITSSMWRDSNSYNELGVPSVSYGFPAGYSSDNLKEYSIKSYRVRVEDVVKATKVYALLALDICSQPA